MCFEEKGVKKFQWKYVRKESLDRFLLKKRENKIDKINYPETIKLRVRSDNVKRQ